MQQHAQQQAAQEGEASNFEGAGSGLSGEPSENIEDRRQDPEYVRDHWLEQYAPGPAPQAQQWGQNPLANALGFMNVGQQPAPAPQVLEPTAPQYPPAFRNFQFGGRLRPPLPSLPVVDH
jgi:hypothetical protein